MKKPFKESICPLPWVHMSTRLDSAMRVCCNTDHGGFILKEDGSPVFLEELKSPEDYYNQPTLKELRRAMVAGERPEYCRSCYRIEDTGGTSIRQSCQKQYEPLMAEELARTSADGTLTNPKVRYLDMAFGNKCNLMCRMCNPYPSYGMKRDFDEEGLSYIKENADWAASRWKVNDDFTSLIRKTLPSVNDILTTGGEPFISEGHRYLLSQAIELGSAKETVLRYHTNLGVIPDELLKLWSHFKRIDVHVSIEAFGGLNEYIRYPLPWARLEKNLKKLSQLTVVLPICIEIHTCFQAYNLLGLTNLLEFLAQNSGGYYPILPYPILLTEPKYLQADALPIELRLEGISRLRSYIDKRRVSLLEDKHKDFHRTALDNFDCYMRNLEAAPFHPQVFNEFVRFTKIFDRRRKQSLASVLPEFEPYFFEASSERSPTL